MTSSVGRGAPTLDSTRKPSYGILCVTRDASIKKIPPGECQYQGGQRRQVEEEEERHARRPRFPEDHPVEESHQNFQAVFTSFFLCLRVLGRWRSD